MIVSTDFFCVNGMTLHDLFDEVKQQINVIGGTLSGDDTVIDKPYSDPTLTELIGYFWSGKHHRVVKGIHLITRSLHRLLR